MPKNIVKAAPASPKVGLEPETSAPTPACIRRRELAALGLTSAAALALVGCGPDRDGLKVKEVQADSSGSVELDKIEKNSTTIVDFGGQSAFVAVVRGDGDDLKGFSAYCTHQGCALEPHGPVLNCPCHGSTFDAETGDVKGGPAEAPLAKIQLSVKNGKVTRA